MGADQAAYKKHDDELGFYTPIFKGFLNEMGLEAANRQALCAATHAHGPDDAHIGAPHRPVECADHAQPLQRGAGAHQRSDADAAGAIPDGMRHEISR